MSRLVVALAGLAALTVVPAHAEDMTVQSLISSYDFTVVGSFPSQIGVGILLQKKDVTLDDVRLNRPVLFVCFAAETPDSPDVKTKYCKPVH